MAMLSVTFTVQASAEESGFLFTTFRDETTPLSEQIYMAISEDGKQWPWSDCRSAQPSGSA